MKRCFVSFPLPVCLTRWTLLRQVVQTLEDHHQEVLSLYRDFGFAGLIAQDSEFALCNVPAYFSSHALKLSWNGKNLTTHQYLLSEAARQLGLKTQHLPCFAALLGEELRPVSAQLLHDTTLTLGAFLLQEITFCLMRTWLPSTGACWDQNTHWLLSRY